VVVGGALYMARWHRDARRFVRRHRRDLRVRPVWLFSSGPLGDDEQKPDIPPVRGVATLMRKVAARGHATFGGCLASDPRGFMARSMATTMAGDWRDPAQVERWSASISADMPATAGATALER
jgi:menaquinone-dependent protoporphyrinogen oxidase